MNDYSVYMHVTPSGKIYIGITKQNVKSRWRNGCGYKGTYFGRAVEKYGWDNITHYVIIQNIDRDFAIELEKYFIALFETENRELGYNRTPGGEGYQMSEENKIKISKRLKGVPLTDEHKAKLSLAKKGKKQSTEVVAKRVAKMKGANNPFYGIGLPKEAIQNSIKKTSKKVESFDDNRNLIKTYNSMSDASKDMGVTPQSIFRAINKRGKCKGFYWQYAN